MRIRNVVIIALAIVVVAVAVVAAMNMLSSDAEEKSLQAFKSGESEAAFVQRYPAIAQKNASAARAEELAAGLPVNLRRIEGKTAGRTPDLDPKLLEAMSTWLKQQHEEPNDDIAPLPALVSDWLAERGPQVDAMARHLDSAAIPRWPMTPSGLRSEQPLPNLLGHMRLTRVLSVAALDAEARGDHERAWMLEHAAWKLAQGLQTRPELISQLIAIAGARMIAATSRKLEPPVPAWFGEVSALQARRGIYDALRFEMTNTTNAIEHEESVRGGDGGTGEQIGMYVMRPALRWAAADAAQAAAAEFQSLRTADACSIDVAAVNKRIEERMSPLSRRFSRVVLANLASGFVRAASAELAIEGTTNVLALKSARDAAGAWPGTWRGGDRSICNGGHWVYSHLASGAPALQFEGARFTEPAGSRAARLTLEFFGR